MPLFPQKGQNNGGDESGSSTNEDGNKNVRPKGASGIAFLHEVGVSFGGDADVGIIAVCVRRNAFDQPSIDEK